MGIDVADLLGIDFRPVQGGFHGPVCAVAVFRRRGDVMGIAGHAVTDHFRIDLRAAFLGVLQFFEHHDAGALAHDESVPRLVPGA